MVNLRRKPAGEDTADRNAGWRLPLRHILLLLFEIALVGALVVWELFVTGDTASPPAAQDPDIQLLVQTVRDQATVIDRLLPVVAFLISQVVLGTVWVIMLDARTETATSSLEAHKIEVLRALDISEIEFNSGDAWPRVRKIAKDYSNLQRAGGRESQVFAELADIEIDHATTVIRDLKSRRYEVDNSPSAFFLAA